MLIITMTYFALLYAMSFHRGDSFPMALLRLIACVVVAVALATVSAPYLA